MNLLTAFHMGTVRPKSKQGNTTNLNISFSMENKKRAAQVGFKLMTYYLEADALPTELLKQLSWLGRIKAIRVNSLT